MANHTQSEQTYAEETAAGPRPGGTGRDRRDEDIRSRMTGYVKSRMSEQVVLSGVKLRKTATALKKTGDCFTEEDQNLVGEYVTRAADQIDRFSAYLQDTPLERIKADARELSLKNPLLFMGACFSTGLVLARVFKASQGRS